MSDLKPEVKHANLKAFLERKKKGQILESSAVSSQSVSGPAQVASKPSINGMDDIGQELVLHDAPKQEGTELTTELQSTLTTVEGEKECSVIVVEDVNEHAAEIESKVLISTEEGFGPCDTSGSGIVCRPILKISENLRTETSETIIVSSDITCIDSNNTFVSETNIEDLKVDRSEVSYVTGDKVVVDLDQNPNVAGMDITINKPDSGTALRELEVAGKTQDVFRSLENVKDSMVGAKDAEVAVDVKVPVVDNVSVVEDSVKADVKVVEEDVMTADKEVEVLSVCKAPKKKKSELDHILGFNKLLSSFEGAYVSPRKAAVAAKIKIENSSNSWAIRKSGSRYSKGKTVTDDHPLNQHTITKPVDVNVNENVKEENSTETQDSIKQSGGEDQAETEETATLTESKPPETAMKPDVSEHETGVMFVNPENAVSVSVSVKKTSDATSIQVSLSPDVDMVCEEIAREEKSEDAETAETKSDELAIASGEPEKLGTSPTKTDCQKNEVKLSVSSVTLEGPGVETSAAKLKTKLSPTEVTQKLENEETKSETSSKIDPTQDTPVKEEEIPGNNDYSKTDICVAAELTSKPKRQRRPSKKMLDSLDSVKLDIPLRRSRRKSAISSSIASYVLETSRSESKTSSPSALGNSEAQDLSIEMAASLPRDSSQSKGSSENRENREFEISPQKKTDQINVIPNSSDTNPKSSNDQSEMTRSTDSKVLPLTSSATGTSSKATRKTPKKFTVIKKPPATTKVAKCSVRTKKNTKKPKEVVQSSETETENLNGSSQRCKDNSTSQLTREALGNSEANTSIDEEIEVGESLRNCDPPPDSSFTGTADCLTENRVRSPFSCQSDTTGQINQTGIIPVNSAKLPVNQPSSVPMLKPGSTVFIISNSGSNNLSSNINLGSLLRSLNFSQMNPPILANQGKMPSQRILLPNVQNKNAPVPMMAYRCNPISPVVAPSQSDQSGVSLSNRNIFQLHSPTLPPQTLSGPAVAASPKITSDAKTVSSSLPIQQNITSDQSNSQLAVGKGSTVERRQTYANVTQQLVNGLAQQPLTPGDTKTEDGVSHETSRKCIQAQSPKIETRGTYANAAQQLLKDLAAMSVKQVGNKADLSSK